MLVLQLYLYSRMRARQFDEIGGRPQIDQLLRVFPCGAHVRLRESKRLGLIVSNGRSNGGRRDRLLRAYSTMAAVRLLGRRFQRWTGRQLWAGNVLHITR